MHEPHIDALDGRRQRAARSRERILDAVAEALSEPDVDITPNAIAARSGVSLSTIVRHFRNREGLVTALRERIRDQVLPILQAGPIEGDLETRVHEHVRRRVAIFELMAPAYHAGPRSLHPGEWRERRDLLERGLKEQLRSTLRDELGNDSGVEAQLATFLSFACWDHLRTTQKVGARRAHTLLVQGALALLR